MSWILGHIGALPDAASFAAVHDASLYRTPEEAPCYIAAGGITKTCAFGTHPGGGWIVVGLGLQQANDRCRLLTSEDWQAVLVQPDPQFASLDGHFAAARWQNEPAQVECFTDPLGVRTLYLAKTPRGITFSTRLDWLTRFVEDTFIDFEAFGAHWLAFNQLSTTSLLHGIRRLGPGGRAVCTPTALRLEETPWRPAETALPDPADAFTETLRAFVRPHLSDGQLSLGLSGGLDSRALLAASAPDAVPRIHVFGTPSHPDVALSQRIAQNEGLSQTHFHADTPSSDTCLALLRKQVAHTQVVSAASSVLGLRYYPQLHAQGAMIIDGGFGEVTRRQFMNRVLRRGRDALHSGDPARMLPYLRVSRADVFAEDVLRIMEHGAVTHLAQTLTILPDPRRMGYENWLDLLAVRTRLPNFFGFEQNRLDGVVAAYMPFAQPSLLHALFHLPLRERRGGRLLRRLIRTYYPELTRYPLVKGTTMYPFSLTPVPAYVYTQLKARLRPTAPDRTRHTFLHALEPFIRDTVASAAVRTEPAYDHAKLTTLVEGYFNGQDELAPSLDWWLAFDMWRRIVTR